MQISTAINIPKPNMIAGQVGPAAYGPGFITDFTNGNQSLDPRITFSRASNATVTGSNGLIQYAPHNLLTFSEQFDNSAWNKAGTTTTTVTANVVAAPDGTVTADRVTFNGTSSADRIFQDSTTNSANGVPVTGSIWLRANTPCTIRLSVERSGPADVEDVVCSVTATWQRFTMAHSSTWTGTSALRLRLHSISAIGSVDAWGAQLELGSTATTYNPTTVKNLLGFSEAFDNAAWTKSNSFIQTNLLLQSEAFDNAAWSKNGSTITANATTAPNGTTTADTLVENTATSRHDIQIASGLSLVSGVAYTASVYAKASGRNFIQITFSGASHGTTQYANFNLATGAVGNNSGGTASIVNVGNGWYRCVFTATSTGTSTASQVICLIDADTASRLPSYTGNGTSGAFLWGAQLVQGSVAGDYQQTTSAALPVMYQDPNGTMTADKLVENTVNAGHIMDISTTVISGTIYTTSIYAKAGERTQFSFRTNSDNTTATFNLSAGTIGTVTNGTGSITAVGNGWYRCSLTWTATSSASVVSLRVRLLDGSGNSSYTGDGTSGIYIWGAQLSDSASLDTYVNNPVAAPSSTAFYGARFDYDPVTLQPRGLLIEEQRSNLLLHTQSLSLTNWSTVSSGVTATTNSTVSPDGSTNASLIIPTATNNYHTIFQSATTTAAPTTLSAYFKPSGYNFCGFREGGTGLWATFNLSTGVVVGTSASTTATITPVGNGWFRCTMTYTATAATYALQLFSIDNGYTSGTPVSYLFTGNASSGTFMWGAQLEAGAFATSYIPTTTAQVTRSADVAVVQGTNFSSWYNVNEGSVFAQAQHADDASTFPRIYTLSDGTANNTMQTLTLQSSNSLYSEVATNGTVVAGLTISSSYTGQLAKTALAYKVNDFAAVANGGTVQTDTSGAVPVCTSLRLGASFAGTAPLNGHIRQIAYYPRRLSNTELQAITS